MVAFFTWLFIDIVLLSTMMIYVTDIFIPSMFICNIDNMRHRVVAALALMRDRCSRGTNRAAEVRFDASRYLYVSKQIAKEHEQLPTSQIILTYITPWPRRSYAKDESLTGAVAVLFLQLFTACMQLPQPMQETLFKISMATIAVGLTLDDSAVSALGSGAYVTFIVGSVFALYAFGKMISWLIRRVDASKSHYCDVSSGLVSTLDESTMLVASSRRPLMASGASSGSVLSSRRQSAELAIESVKEIERRLSTFDASAKSNSIACITLPRSPSASPYSSDDDSNLSDISF